MPRVVTVEAKAGYVFSPLEFQRRMYESERNPLFVWSALRDCLRAGRPVPNWVSEYLLRVADRFESLPRKFSRSPRDARSRAEKKVPAKVLECLEFKKPGKSGRGHFLLDYEPIGFSDQLALASEVQFLMTSEGLNDWKASEAVAADSKTPISTVRRAWKKYESVLRGTCRVHKRGKVETR